MINSEVVGLNPSLILAMVKCQSPIQHLLNNLLTFIDIH